MLMSTIQINWNCDWVIDCYRQIVYTVSFYLSHSAIYTLFFSCLLDEADNYERSVEECGAPSRDEHVCCKVINCFTDHA